MAIVPYRTSADQYAPLLGDLLRPFLSVPAGGMLRTPDADVMETDKEIRLTVEMPGMRPDEIRIEAENNVLTISGEKREERSEGEDGSYQLTERRFGRFSRSFVLPRDVESDRIDARYENGVLTITIPKSEKAQRRRIDVRQGSEQSQAAGTGTDSRGE